MNISKLLIAPAVVALLAACGSDSSDSSDFSDGGDGDVEVSEAWVREPAEGQPNAAGYGTITNNTGDEIVLVGASAAITATFELHETTMNDDGTMSMEEVESGFTIAPGDSLTLEPGGPHVMMLGIDAEEFSDELDLTFVFDGSDPVTVPAEVRAVDGEAMDESQDGHEMDDMEEGEPETTEFPDPMDE